MIYEMKKGKPEQKRAKKRNNGEKQRKPFQENRLKRKKKNSMALTALSDKKNYSDSLVIGMEFLTVFVIWGMKRLQPLP